MNHFIATKDKKSKSYFVNVSVVVTLFACFFVLFSFSSMFGTKPRLSCCVHKHSTTEQSPKLLKFSQGRRSSRSFEGEA